MVNNPTIKELENLKSQLLEQVEHVDKTLNFLKSMSFPFIGNGNGSKNIEEKKTTPKYDDYDKEGSVRSKVAYVLKKKNKFLRIREIAEVLHSYEPETSVNEFVEKLSAPITYLKGQGAIVKVTVGKGYLNTFWGSAKWVDENGNPKPEHMYDEKQLINNNAEEIEI